VIKSTIKYQPTLMALFWVVAPCSLVVLAASIAIALMMEAARTSETLVNLYQTTRRYNPEDSHLRTYRRENLKSYQATLFQCLGNGEIT
jgi:hypothetical protein